MRRHKNAHTLIQNLNTQAQENITIKYFLTTDVYQSWCIQVVNMFSNKNQFLLIFMVSIFPLNTNACNIYGN